MSIKKKRIILYFSDGKVDSTNLITATMDEAINIAESIVKNNGIYKYEIQLEGNDIIYTKDYSD